MELFLSGKIIFGNPFLACFNFSYFIILIKLYYLQPSTTDGLENMLAAGS